MNEDPEKNNVHYIDGSPEKMQIESKGNFEVSDNTEKHQF